MPVYQWVDHYKPKSFSDYVWKDDHMKDKILEYVHQGAMPHSLMCGRAGTGKTSCLSVILHELKIPKGDILWIPASRHRNIDVIQDKIGTFVSTWALGETGIKYVVLDELDSVSQAAQKILRTDMEVYADTARFLATCVTGDTKTYTNNGWVLTENIKDQMLQTGDGRTKQNRYLKHSVANKIIKLKTLHGFEINVTEDHQFKFSNYWVKAKDLLVGNRVSVSLSSLYGNDFERKDQNQPFLNVANFELFLTQNRILYKRVFDEIRAIKFFIPPYLMKRMRDVHLPDTLTAQNLADLLGTKIHTARSTVLARLMKTGLVKTERTKNGEKKFIAKWIEVLDFIDEQWQMLVNDHSLVNDSYATFYYDYFERSKGVMYYVEEIVSNLKHIFNNEKHYEKILGRLCGFLYGDGHLNFSGLCFAASNNEVLHKINDDISTVFNKESQKIKTNGKNSNGVCVHFNDKTISLFFRYLGVPCGNKVNQSFNMPPACNISDVFGRAFIQGLYDCDGLTPKLKYHNRGGINLVLRQNTKDEKNTFHVEVVEYLKRFGIHAKLSVSDKFHASEFNGNVRKDAELRYTSAISIYDEDNVLSFFKNVGSYYEEKKICSDLMGYLIYKKEFGNSKAMAFDNWKIAFDYENGVINDKIVSTEVIDGEFNVYDCCLDEIHSYVTNGLISHNCNYRNKIIEPLRSRFQEFIFSAIDLTEFTVRAAMILNAEEVKYDLDLLNDYIQQYYPDLRKCINELQKNTVDNELRCKTDDDESNKDYMFDVVAMFKAKKYLEARKLIVSQAQPEEYEELYRFFYNNLELFGSTQDQQDDATIIIKTGLVEHSMMADVEINLSSVLIQLCRIANK